MCLHSQPGVIPTTWGYLGCVGVGAWGRPGHAYPIRDLPCRVERLPAHQAKSLKRDHGPRSADHIVRTEFLHAMLEIALEPRLVRDRPVEEAAAAGTARRGRWRLSGYQALFRPPCGRCQPCKNSPRRVFHLERVAFLGLTRIRPRTHDDTPAQPLPRWESPPPVQLAPRRTSRP